MRLALVAFILTMGGPVGSVLSAPDLTGYTLAFDEEFNGPLSISAYGPGTKWIAHTPYGGDFGEAWFSNSTDPISPFRIKDGILTHYGFEGSQPEESLEVRALVVGRYQGKWLCSSARLL